ncbi:MAG: type II toxin-antitoxin system Phd/YefM family antitoxin [Acidimicrobiales bacterium]
MDEHFDRDLSTILEDGLRAGELPGPACGIEDGTALVLSNVAAEAVGSRGQAGVRHGCSEAQVTSKFSEMVDRVQHTHDRIVVTRGGRPAAVMMSPDELASLEDTLELFSDSDALAELAQARQVHAVGGYITGDELRARFAPK